MTSPSDNPPQGVPTLTEVVDWRTAAPAAPGDAQQDGMNAADPANATDAPSPEAAELAPAAAGGPPPRLPSESELAEQVLAQVQRQLDLMIEYRMREALMPLLARATDTLVRDARGELASTLRDVVTRAVAQELARLRNR